MYKTVYMALTSTMVLAIAILIGMFFTMISNMAKKCEDLEKLAISLKQKK